MTSSIKLLSFDLDNCLYDNQRVIIQAERASADYLKRVFLSQNQYFNYADFNKIKLQLSMQDKPEYDDLTLLRKVALKQFCGGLKDSELVAENALNQFLVARSKVTIEPEIILLLELLSKRYILVSVTNGNCDINKTTIGKYFSKNYSPGGGFRSKPNPQMLSQVILDFNLKISQLIHIGDSVEKDGGCANHANVKFFCFQPFIDQADLKIACEKLKEKLL